MHREFPVTIAYYALLDEFLNILKKSASERGWKIEEESFEQTSEPPEEGKGKYYDEIKSYRITDGKNVLYKLVQSGHDEHLLERRGLDKYHSLLREGKGLMPILESKLFYTTPSPGSDEIDENRIYPYEQGTKLYSHDEFASEIFRKINAHYESQLKRESSRLKSQELCRQSA